MPSYELLALLGGTVFVGLLVYQRLWIRIYRRRSRLEGLSRLRGRVLEVDPITLHVALERGEGDPAQLLVSIEGAELQAWPGPGAWRRTRDLRPGDPITALGVEQAASGGAPGFAALRVVRGDWPQLPWFGLPVAFAAAIAGLLLSQLIREPVLVARVFPSPSTAETVRYAHGGTSVRAILELTRRIEPVHDWAMTTEPDREPDAGPSAEALEAPSDEGAAGARAETLFDYLESRPRLANGARRYLYLQPIGPLGARPAEVLEHTADFLARYFCLPVKLAEEIPLSRVSWHAKRIHPSWGIPQLLSTWIVHSLLRSRRPDDAAAYLGMTSVDLWPGPGWHSINGQASPVARVGVLSTYRNGDLARPDRFRIHLLRTLKVAAHETAHMFSIRHCPRHGCLMSSRNDRAVADRRLLALCPDCLAKLLVAIPACDPIARYRSLLAFFERRGLAAEAALQRRLLTATTSQAAD